MLDYIKSKMNIIGFCLGFLSVVFSSGSSWMLWIGLFLMGITLADMYATKIIEEDSKND